jgi:spore coat protein U-like protein
VQAALPLSRRCCRADTDAVLVNKTAVLIAGTAALGAGGASAENLNYSLGAQINPVCGAFATGGPAIEVDFGSLANVPTDQTVQARAGSVTYRCNSLNGYSRTISSQNGGFLTLEGNPTTDDARRIPFTMRQTGANGMPTTTVFAGNYRDTVTVTVTAN